MPPQRARGAGNRAGIQAGKWTAEGAGKGFGAEYPATCGHTSVAGGMLVLREVRGPLAAKQGGTASDMIARP